MIAKTRALPRALQRVPKRLDEGADGFHRSWIMLFPEGTFQHPQYGKLNFTRAKLSEIKANFDNRVRHIDIALDVDHKGGGEDSRATGWIEALELRGGMSLAGGAGLWARIKWTPYGKRLLQDEEYRYFSPEFGPWTDPETGKDYDNVLIGGGLTNRPFLKVMPAVRLSWRDRPREETHVTSLDEYRYWLTKAESARELADSYVERAYMADRVALTPPDEDENDQADEELDASEFDDSDDEELDDTEEEDDQTHRLRMLALSMNMSAGPEGTPWEVTPRARTLSDQELADETNKATAGTGRPPLQALVNASANTSADSERQQRLLALSAAVAQQQGTSLENVRQRAIDGDREAQMQLAQIYNAASARAIAAASTGNRPPISQGVATPWKQGTNY